MKKIDTPKLKPTLVFDDEYIKVGERKYYYTDLKGIWVVYEPTFMANGVLAIQMEHDLIKVDYTKKSTELVNELVNQTKERILDNPGAILYAAEELYNICIAKKFDAGISKKKAFRNYQAMIDKLEKGEKVIVSFTGRLKRLGEKKENFGVSSYLVTDKRIMIEGSKFGSRFDFQIVWDEIKGMKSHMVDLLGVIEVSLKDGTIANIIVNYDKLQEIYIELIDALANVKK